MIDELKGFGYLVLMSGIRVIQAPVEECEIDCLISTVRRDSTSILLRFLHFAGCPQDRYFENKVSPPITWPFELKRLAVHLSEPQEHTASLRRSVKGEQEYGCT